MAVTSYGVNANEAVKLWSRKLFREALNQTSLSRFMGTDTNSIIQIVDETSKGPGDRVRVTLRKQLNDDGIEGDATLEGNEEALSTSTDDLVINQLRHAVRSGGRMSEQRIPFSVRNEARMGLQDWWADRIDTSLFNHLAGNAAETRTKYTGHNSVTTADSSHTIYAAGTSDADVSASVSAKFTLSLIDSAVETAETLSDNPIRPLQIGGEPYYVCFLHPFQAKDLRVNTDTGQWLDIQKAAMQGGEVTRNPIFSGALGVYNQTILHKNVRVPLGFTGTTNSDVVRSAVFCGAQSGILAFGRNNGPTNMTWVEELFDFQNQLGVSAGMIWGAKRAIFDSESFATIRISTYASGSD